MAGSLYTREVSVLAEVSVAEQVLREISKFPEILGKLSMRKQCVPGCFLPAHAREPGNEANHTTAVQLQLSVNMTTILHVAVHPLPSHMDFLPKTPEIAPTEIEDTKVFNGTIDDSLQGKQVAPENDDTVCLCFTTNVCIFCM